MRDEAADRRPDVRLQMLLVVPHERADAVAVLEAERPQGDRQPLRPRDEIGVGGAMPALVGLPSHDLAVAEELVAPAEDRRHVELVVHHQALHLTLLRRAGGPRPRRVAALRTPPTTGCRAPACSSRCSGCSHVKPIPPCAWIERSQARTAASAASDFAAAAAIAVCASSVATHQAAHNASERASSSCGVRVGERVRDGLVDADRRPNCSRSETYSTASSSARRADSARLQRERRE